MGSGDEVLAYNRRDMDIGPGRRVLMAIGVSDLTELHLIRVK